MKQQDSTRTVFEMEIIHSGCCFAFFHHDFVVWGSGEVSSFRLPLVEFCEHSAEVKCVALPPSDADDFSATGSDGIGSGMASPWGTMATLLLSGAADGTQRVLLSHPCKRYFVWYVIGQFLTCCRLYLPAGSTMVWDWRSKSHVATLSAHEASVCGVSFGRFVFITQPARTHILSYLSPQICGCP
jgi:hypothetical protein